MQTANRTKVALLAVFLLTAARPLFSAPPTRDEGISIARKPTGSDSRRVSVLHADANVVLVPVTVTDPSGIPVNGLTRQTFRVLEDNVEQKVTYFATQDAPVSATILFDASGSMAKKLPAARHAITEFLKSSMPGDEYSLIRFSDRPETMQSLTGSTAAIESQLPGIVAAGWTAMFDAIYLGVQDMREAKNARKILLIVSDGGDNSSRYTESEMRNLVRESDVCIYAIGLLGSGLSKRSVRLLSRLSEATGGGFYPVEKLKDLPEAMARINAQIRNQYLLGYIPSAAVRDGKFRHVSVKLEPPARSQPLRASWREGYYSPAP